MELRRSPSLGIPPFPLGIAKINGVNVSAGCDKVELIKKDVENYLKTRYTLEELKNVPVVRAYRDFYWKYLGIDPTKKRPSGEALARRILAGKKFPRILCVVDAYNLASARTLVSFGAYDADKIEGNVLLLDRAKPGEEFLGIGMKESISLSGKELVLRDEKGAINIYPYRDSVRTMITTSTTSIVLIGAGVVGIEPEYLKEAMELAMEYILSVGGGNMEYMMITLK